jgi:hypothetical protein
MTLKYSEKEILIQKGKNKKQKKNGKVKKLV